MNRILKRPMFRMGGSSGTGITSGLDRTGYAGDEPTFKEFLDALGKGQRQMQEQNLFKEYQDFLKKRQVAKQRDMAADGGRIGYANGSPNFMSGGFPGFLTGLGLNLLATPPQGNIFATVGKAAQDPFARLQASQAAAMKTASDRAFARELSEEEREFEREQLEKRLGVEREKIAKMGGGDLMKRIESAKQNYGGNEIKAAREIDFYDNKFTELQGSYGDEGVYIDPVDISQYEKQKNGLEKFVKQNPQAGRQVVYDVATGKAVRIVKDTVTGKLKVVPADSADIDTTGDTQPPPVVRNPGYLRPPKEADLSEEGFGIGFYD